MLPCQFKAGCEGPLVIYPKIGVQHTHTIHDGYVCSTEVRVTCDLVIECQGCRQSELVDTVNQDFDFAQEYQPDVTWSVVSLEEILAGIRANNGRLRPRVKNRRAEP